MAHHIYQTEGLVVRSSHEGEASMYLEIFTRELGLVGAHARSVRAEKSKLRYALADFSLSHVSLVRGKHSWKIINAIPQENLYFTLKAEPHKSAAFLRIIGLLQKLIRGEDRHTALYDTLSNALQMLVRPDLSRDDVLDLQLLSALRILHHLGYGVDHVALGEVAKEDTWNVENLKSIRDLRVPAKDLIKKSLAASHL